MSTKRLSMRKIRDVLRLREGGLSLRQIAKSLGLGRSTVGDTLARARKAGLWWPLPGDLDEAALERMLYRSPTVLSTEHRPQPEWPVLHRELRRKGVTRFLLWQEYRQDHPRGTDLCRRTGGFQLHLCGGDLESKPSRLDRLAPARIPVPERCPGDPCTG